MDCDAGLDESPLSHDRRRASAVVVVELVLAAALGVDDVAADEDAVEVGDGVEDPLRLAPSAPAPAPPPAPPPPEPPPPPLLTIALCRRAAGTSAPLTSPPARSMAVRRRRPLDGM